MCQKGLRFWDKTKIDICPLLVTTTCFTSSRDRRPVRSYCRADCVEPRLVSFTIWIESIMHIENYTRELIHSRRHIKHVRSMCIRHSTAKQRAKTIPHKLRTPSNVVGDMLSYKRQRTQMYITQICGMLRRHWQILPRGSHVLPEAENYQQSILR